MWASLIELQDFFGSNIVKIFYILLLDNFRYDPSFVSGNLYEFFSPQLLAWLLVGFLSGSIAKGRKRGILIAIVIVIIDLLLWVIVGIVIGEDMFALFQDMNLVLTIGGIISALIGGSGGGLIGGAVSGPYQG